jgi:hypothetical protein
MLSMCCPDLLPPRNSTTGAALDFPGFTATCGGTCLVAAEEVSLRRAGKRAHLQS